VKKYLNIAALSMMLCPVCSVSAQSGIYNTAADYSNNKLTYETQCSTSKNNNIRLHNYFGYAPYVTVVAGGIKHRLKKSEVYGFRNCNNEVFRFYKNKEYKLSEAGHICIYTAQQNITQGKSFKLVNGYYFSTSFTGPILPLTYGNLENAYAGNEKFCELLEQFSGTNDASAYDSRHKTYKINYLFAKSIN
jgi:hypothetical protein